MVRRPAAVLPATWAASQMVSPSPFSAPAALVALAVLAWVVLAVVVTH